MNTESIHIILGSVSTAANTVNTKVDQVLAKVNMLPLCASGNDAATASGGGGIDTFIVIIALIAVLVLGYYIYKHIESLRSEVRSLKDELDVIKEKTILSESSSSNLPQTTATTDTKRTKPTSDSAQSAAASDSKPTKPTSDSAQSAAASDAKQTKPASDSAQSTNTAQSKPVSTAKANTPKAKGTAPKTERKAYTVMYGTPQAPDPATGKVRFHTRSIFKDSSIDSYFELHLNEAQGTGTYHINSEATTAILKDLQTFANFVDSFSVSGNLGASKLTEVTEGTLVKDGSYWVIQQLLKISL